MTVMSTVLLVMMQTVDVNNDDDVEYFVVDVVVVGNDDGDNGDDYDVSLCASTWSEDSTTLSELALPCYSLSTW